MPYHVRLVQVCSVHVHASRYSVLPISGNFNFTISSGEDVYILYVVCKMRMDLDDILLKFADSWKDRGNMQGGTHAICSLWSS